MRTIQKQKPERQIAKERGERVYFTGRPCSRGHQANRSVSDASCTACREEDRHAKRVAFARYMRERRASELAIDPDGTRARWRAQNQRRRKLHPEVVRAAERQYSRIKRARYPERKLAEVRARQAAKLERTPAWADLKAIREFYAACPPGYEVDHIIPLRGNTVSGLHVLDNLQYLPSETNRAKGNRFIMDMAP